MEKIPKEHFSLFLVIGKRLFFLLVIMQNHKWKKQICQFLVFCNHSQDDCGGST